YRYRQRVEQLALGLLRALPCGRAGGAFAAMGVQREVARQRFGAEPATELKTVHAAPPGVRPAGWTSVAAAPGKAGSSPHRVAGRVHRRSRRSSSRPAPAATAARDI